MAYSTDLNAKENPFPGKIFTDSADNTDGDWAQYGCFDHIDYYWHPFRREAFER